MARTGILVPKDEPQGVLQAFAPSIITREGPRVTKRFLEFFAATIQNRHTREAYIRAVGRFLSWCEERGLNLHTIEPAPSLSKPPLRLVLNRSSRVDHDPRRKSCFKS